MRRRIAIVAGAVAAALVLLLVLVPAVMDWSRFRGIIAARAEAALGRPVAIDGPLRVRLLPLPAATADLVRVANLPGAEPAAMATVDKLVLRLKLWPLLRGAVVVESVLLDTPHLHLQRLADGRANWQFTPPPAEAAAPPATTGQDAKPAAPREHGGGVEIRTVEIRHGLLTWQSGGGRPLSLDSLEGTVSLDPAPLARLSGKLGGVPLSLEGRLARWPSDGPVPAALSLSAPGGSLGLRGTVTPSEAGPSLSASLEGRVAPEVVAALGGPAGVPVTVAGTLAANAAEASLSDLVVAAGPDSARGTVVATLAGMPRVDADVTVASLNLDAWTRKAPPPPPPPAAVPAPAAPASSPASSAAPAVEAPAAVAAQGFALPAGVAVNASLGVDRLVWRGREVAQIHVDAALDQGELVIGQASAVLPGGGTLSGLGTLAAGGGFTGRVDLAAPEARDVLTWLGVDVSAVPADRLHRLRAAAEVATTADEIHLQDLSAQVDDVRLAGQVSARRNGAVEADVTVGGLVVGGVPVESLALSAGLAGGDVTIRSLDGTVAGTRAHLAGAVRGVGGSAPRFDGLAFSLDAGDPGRLGRAVGVALPATLGRVMATGTLSGPLEATAIRLHLAADGVEADADGSLSAARQFDGTLAVRAEEAARLVRMLWPQAHPRGRPGPLALTTRAVADERDIRLDGLDLHWGESHVSGSARVGLGGVRPSVEADLSADTIALDGWLSAQRSGAVLPPLPAGLRAAPQRGRDGPSPAAQPVALHAAAGAPWSSEPMDLSFLRGLDARLDLQAGAVTWDGWRLEGAKAHATVGDGVAALAPLSGRLLGGDVNVALRLTGGSLPQVSGTLQLAGADLGRAPRGNGQVQLTRGTLSGELRFGAVGRSPAEMVSRLSGEGRAVVRDGTVAGFDLPAVNRHLADLRNIGNLFALVQTGLSGGTTRFSSLSGSARASGGVVTTNDIRLEADGGSGSGEAVVDLPRWTIQSRVALRMADGSAPPLALRFEGPLDQPRKVVDINELQRWLVERGLGKALRGKGGLEGLFGGGGGASDGKPTGRQLLEGLWKGLGGK